MAFRFSLETVLRLRCSLEDNERLRLQTLLAERAHLERAIGETTSIHVALAAKLKTSLRQEEPTGGEMHFALQRLSACDLQAARLRASRDSLTQHIERQQAVLLRCRRDRKVLEQLRTGQQTRYESEQQHRAQLQVEELFLLRIERERAIGNYPTIE